ncbi:MAG: 50S ribosomal protein L17 [Saprospiraceae bacterium]|jgi:large subunit ribosomal protein L17
MRHGDKVNNLGRTASHRKALLKNMSCSLIQHKRINTTLAKAKALRKHIEPIITKAKDNTTHSRRVIFSYLMDKESIKELFAVIAPKIADRPGGYMRIIRTGFRKGDGAEMAMIEFVDFNETYSTAKEGGAEKKKRTRRGASKAATTAAATKPAKVEAKEEIVEPTQDVVEDTATEEKTEE